MQNFSFLTTRFLLYYIFIPMNKYIVSIYCIYIAKERLCSMVHCTCYCDKQLLVKIIIIGMKWNKTCNESTRVGVGGSVRFVKRNETVWEKSWFELYVDIIETCSIRVIKIDSIISIILFRKVKSKKRKVLSQT